MPGTRCDRDIAPSEITPVIHLVGVAYARWRHRENLVAAMITGRKR